MKQSIPGFEEGWEIIQMEITKLTNILEGVPDESPMDAMMIYNTVYSLCTRKPPPDCSELEIFSELYERYAGVYNNYLQSKVLPAIQEKHGDDVSMLQELVKRWANHKVMVTKLCRCFSYLDRYFTRLKKLPTLKDVGYGCFCKIVGEEMKVKDVVMALINQECGEKETDQTLLKSVTEIFVDLGIKDVEDTRNLATAPPSEVTAPVPI